MFIDLTYQQIEENEKYLLIDVRSEGEFEEATIPGAINIPLFTNEERAKVGTIYKQSGPDIARETGLEIVSPKIPQLVKKVKNFLKEGQIPLFFCWRGGMRSKSMATFYELIHGETYRLEGGYRAYREYILGQISLKPMTTPTFVLHGMTGVGKTLLLNGLREKGFTILDLEELAGHRGSAFGAIGKNPVNQKRFDSALYDELKKIHSSDAFIMEAESQRIGKILVPDQIMDAKEKGSHILVHASIETRVNRILEEYQLDQYKEPFVAGIQRIERKLPSEIRPLIHEALDSNDFYTAVKYLLEYYYDPRYQFSTDQYNGGFFEINSDDLDFAVGKIAEYIQGKIALIKA